jgi:hypothetical protein
MDSRTNDGRPLTSIAPFRRKAMRQTIQMRSWKAVPTDSGESDYWIHDHRGIRGLARSEAAARNWLEIASGIAYERLPAIKRSELQVIEEPKIKTYEFPYHGWYRHTVYKLNGKELGRIQTKYMRKRITVMTLAQERGIQGGDLRWLLEQAGYRLVSEFAT